MASSDEDLGPPVLGYQPRFLPGSSQGVFRVNGAGEVVSALLGRRRLPSSLPVNQSVSRHELTEVGSQR